MAEAAERLYIALYLDENVDERLAPALRRYGYDVLTTTEAGRKGSRDDDQLRYAAAQRRALLSHNIADFARMAEQWRAREIEHWGIFLTREVGFRSLLQRVLKVLDHYGADEVKNRVVFL